jgi:carbon-monoxide dehydrogenase medium subunit
LQRRLAPEALQNCVLDAGIAMGDIHASAAFRAHLAAVLTRRAVQHILKSSKL